MKYLKILTHSRKWVRTDVDCIPDGRGTLRCRPQAEAENPGLCSPRLAGPLPSNRPVLQRLLLSLTFTLFPNVVPTLPNAAFSIQRISLIREITHKVTRTAPEIPTPTAEDRISSSNESFPFLSDLLSEGRLTLKPPALFTSTIKFSFKSVF